jgi:hypothetical protein
MRSLKERGRAQKMTESDIIIFYVESTQSSTTNPDPDTSKKVRIVIGGLLRRGSNPKPICTEGLGLGLEIGAARGQSGPTQMLDDVS